MNQTILNESRGFAARKPGDQFIDPTNTQDVATFMGLTLLPSSGQDSFETHQEFLDAYQDWQDENSNNQTIYELNKPISVIRSAMIVNMDTPRGPESFVMFTRDNRRLEGKLTDIPPHIIDNHGGYVLNRATSLSERAGLKPSDVLSGKKAYSPKQVADLLDAARSTAGDQAVDQMQGYLEALANKNGQDYVIVNGAKNASLHQKYLGEWAAPIALITAQFDPKSQLPELEDAILEGNSIKNAKIIYNTNVSEALFDSLIDLKGLQILISSKAHKGGGAAASLKGLYDTIHQKHDQFPDEFWQNDKHIKFKDIVDTIMTNSSIDGILELARSEKIIPIKDVGIIKTLIADNETDSSKLSKQTQELLADYAANQNHPQYNAGKHALASIARNLCKKLNNENFTDVAKAILNKSNVVQMMFITKIQGQDLIAKGFHLIWPPNFDGNIKFYSGKAFSATEIKGRLCFKISRSAADEIPEPDPSLTAPSLTKLELSKKKREAELAVGKITNPGERDKRDIRVSDKIALGRSMKKR